MSLQDTVSCHSCAVSGCLHNPGLCLTRTHTHIHTSTPKTRFTVFINLSPVLTRHRVLSFLCCVRFHTHTHTPPIIQNCVDCTSIETKQNRTMPGCKSTISQVYSQLTMFSFVTAGVALSSGRNPIVRNTADFL